jgi:hypothetical protein
MGAKKKIEKRRNRDQVVDKISRRIHFRRKLTIVLQVTLKIDIQIKGKGVRFSLARLVELQESGHQGELLAQKKNVESHPHQVHVALRHQALQEKHCRLEMLHPHELFDRCHREVSERHMLKRIGFDAHGQKSAPVFEEKELVQLRHQGNPSQELRNLLALRDSQKQSPQREASLGVRYR